MDLAQQENIKKDFWISPKAGDINTMTMDEIIQRTVEVLRHGGTILYPTDTIWGIGCDARNDEAVERLYTIKERDRKKSMLVLISAELGERRAELNDPHITSELRSPNSELSRPTTYILPERRWRELLGDSIAPNLAADDGSLGVRAADHPFCQEVIRRLGAPLVSTSANLSGHPSPRAYHEIEEELRRRVDYCVPPLPAFVSGETRGSRIVKVDEEGNETVVRE